jgi:hypothetical protein
MEHRHIKGVFDKGDVEVMTAAFHLAVEKSAGQQVDQECLGRIVLKLFNMGLVEREKLAAVAAMMITTRLFRSYDLVEQRSSRGAGEFALRDK